MLEDKVGAQSSENVELGLNGKRLVYRRLPKKIVTLRGRKKGGKQNYCSYVVDRALYILVGLRVWRRRNVMECVVEC